MSQIVVFGNACSIAGLTLVAYDTLLTFSREVECIWRKKLSFVTAIFVTQRWIMILDAIIDMQPNTSLSYSFACAVATSLSCFGFRCVGTIIFDEILIILGLLSTVVFSTLRIWAIWGHAFIPALLVFLTGIVVPALNLFSMAYPKTFAFDQEDGICIQSDSLTPDLLKKMLLVLNIVTLLLDNIQTDAEEGPSVFIVVVTSVAANLIARFILDLRSADDEASGSQPTAATMSSVNFGHRSFAGNMGAALSIEGSTWISNAGDDVMESRDEQGNETSPPEAVRGGMDLEAEEIVLEDIPFHRDGAYKNAPVDITTYTETSQHGMVDVARVV
ncbi:hypothetical protein EIP91_001596 [Steccherinum ochraceum]|uniref:DUF6533 domain-containing protein n=1 Tax=Steccherinum ochraceum TaxID=92696 RepID=A0A4V2MWH0_9APHY|nr:hypothetical protein EIP91_001596 [Steccherinum ochraceum]